MFYREPALTRLRGFVVSHEGSSFVSPHRDPDRTVVVLYGRPRIRSEKGREAETAECAGGGLLLLSRGPRGSKRQMQEFAGGSRAI